MAQAIFKEVALKGYDPRRFTILAYGGNGATHACGFAEGLGVNRILVPQNSAIFSAVGAGNMDQLHIYERSVYVSLYDALTNSLYDDFGFLNDVIDELKAKGVKDILRQGYAAEQVRFRIEFDMRYGDQLQLTSMVSPYERFTTARQVLDMIKRYHESYGERFGQGTQTPETGIKVNQIRVISYVPLEKVSFRANGHNGASGAGAEKGTRRAFFPSLGTFVEAPVYDAGALAVGREVEGPAIAEAPHTTFVVYPGWTLRTLNNHFVEMRRAA